MLLNHNKYSHGPRPDSTITPSDHFPIPPFSNHRYPSALSTELGHLLLKNLRFRDLPRMPTWLVKLNSRLPERSAQADFIERKGENDPTEAITSRLSFRRVRSISRRCRFARPSRSFINRPIETGLRELSGKP